MQNSKMAQEYGRLPDEKLIQLGVQPPIAINCAGNKLASELRRVPSASGGGLLGCWVHASALVRLQASSLLLFLLLRMLTDAACTARAHNVLPSYN